VAREVYGWRRSSPKGSIARRGSSSATTCSPRSPAAPARIEDVQALRGVPRGESERFSKRSAGRRRSRRKSTPKSRPARTTRRTSCCSGTPRRRVGGSVCAPQLGPTSCRRDPPEGRGAGTGGEASLPDVPLTAGGERGDPLRTARRPRRHTHRSGGEANSAAPLAFVPIAATLRRPGGAGENTLSSADVGHVSNVPPLTGTWNVPHASAEHRERAEVPEPEFPYQFNPAQVPQGVVLSCPRCGTQFHLGPPAAAPPPPRRTRLPHRPRRRRTVYRSLAGGPSRLQTFFLVLFSAIVSPGSGWNYFGSSTSPMGKSPRRGRGASRHQPGVQTPPAPWSRTRRSGRESLAVLPRVQAVGAGSVHGIRGEGLPDADAAVQ